jgi:hypothetical protein
MCPQPWPSVQFLPILWVDCPCLMSLTRAELFALHRRIVSALALLPAGSPDRLTALANLRDIRGVLSRPNAVPH